MSQAATTAETAPVTTMTMTKLATSLVRRESVILHI